MNLNQRTGGMLECICIVYHYKEARGRYSATIASYKHRQSECATK